MNTPGSCPEDVTYDPSALKARLAPGKTPEQFIADLLPTQSVPCPWGSLRGMTDYQIYEMFYEWSKGTMDYPLALELGCGIRYTGNFYDGTTFPPIGMPQAVIQADFVRPDFLLQMPEYYVRMDLTKPEHVSLGGIRCHAMSVNMDMCEPQSIIEACHDARFRVDGRDTSWSKMPEAVDRLPELLLPDGIMYISTPHFVGFPAPIHAYAEKHNLNIFRCGLDSVMLQKRA